MARKLNIFTITCMHGGTPLAFEKDINQIKLLLMNMGPNEYQASALTHLMLVRKTKAPTINSYLSAFFMFSEGRIKSLISITASFEHRGLCNARV